MSIAELKRRIREITEQLANCEEPLSKFNLLKEAVQLKMALLIKTQGGPSIQSHHSDCDSYFAAGKFSMANESLFRNDLEGIECTPANPEDKGFFFEQFLSKCQQKTLDFEMTLSLETEKYERCAIVREAAKKRGLIWDHDKKEFTKLNTHP